MPKREYYVEIPLTGIASGNVVAESEEEAIEIFAEQCTSDNLDWNVDASRGTATDEGEVEDDDEIEEE